jgi:DEAD/DEAH box helicase
MTDTMDDDDWLLEAEEIYNRPKSPPATTDLSPAPSDEEEDEGPSPSMSPIERDEVRYPRSVKLFSRWLLHWKICPRRPRTYFISKKGTILDKQGHTYKDGKTPEFPAMDDPRFSPQQQGLADELHEGNNIILDWTTSTGKTWATLQVVCYETLMRQRNEATALIISPNTETMKEAIDTIQQNHFKEYRSGGKMCGTQTRSFCNYDEHVEPVSQIICITADNFKDFIINEINRNFISRMKYIVFDEVHMKEVGEPLWWHQFIPTGDLCFVLCSATISNMSEIQTLLANISKKKTVVLHNNIRPIPLQRALFKGCDMPSDGIGGKSLLRAGRISCQVNQADPTLRDMVSLEQSLKDDLRLAKDRTYQYEVGRRLMEREGVTETIRQKTLADLDSAVLDASPENILKLLCYLFSNNMAPALVFHTDPSQVKRLAQGVVGLLYQIEEADQDVSRAKKAEAWFQKNERKRMDKTDDAADSKAKRKISGWGSLGAKGDHSDRGEDGAYSTDDLERIRKLQSDLPYLKKWKFPNSIKRPDGYNGKPLPLPEWIGSALDYGILIYTHDMKPRIKEFMFNCFKEKNGYVMFADTSISVGINLPARTTILCGDLDRATYGQTGGRAGRRGLDTQGFVIPMCPLENAKSCLIGTDVAQSASFPTELDFGDLVRLTTPVELDMFYAPLPGDRLEPDLSHFSGEAKKRPIREIILSKYTEYSKHLGPEREEQLQTKLELIYGDQWHCNQVTKMIGYLPHRNTIVFISLLIDGTFARLPDSELRDAIIKAISTLIAPPPESDPEPAHVADPIDVKISGYCDKYMLQKPDSRLSGDCVRKFYTTGEYDISDLDQILKVHEWIYLLLRILDDEIPDPRVLAKKSNFKDIHKVKKINIGVCPSRDPDRPHEPFTEDRFLVAVKQIQKVFDGRMIHAKLL